MKFTPSSEAISNDTGEKLEWIHGNVLMDSDVTALIHCETQATAPQ